jgi:hypothetical protein
MKWRRMIFRSHIHLGVVGNQQAGGFKLASTSR